VVQRFVVDTSAFLEAGAGIFEAFEDGAEIILPLTVVRELEDKRGSEGLGFAARQILGILDECSRTGELSEGVPYKKITVRVELNHVGLEDLPDLMKYDKQADTRILAVAKHLDATLVTKDRPLRILAGLVQVPVQKDAKPASAQDVDTIQTLHISDEEMSDLYASGTLRLEKELPLNSPVILRSSSGGSALAVQERSWNYRLVKDRTAFSVAPRSAEQRFYMDHLFNQDIQIVSAAGAAGSGKTLLAIAAALQQVEDPKTPYKRVMVFRSTQAVGDSDIGFLPGTAEDKWAPYWGAVDDALDVVYDRQDSKIKGLKKDNVIDVSTPTYLSGRSLNGTIIIVDEVQEFSLSVLHTIISRTGAGSKIILLGDVAQRNNRFVGRWDGIHQVIQRFYGESIFAHVTLKKSERSKVAELAARLLVD
jgi:PhoH-like ATPase